MYVEVRRNFDKCRRRDFLSIERKLRNFICRSCVEVVERVDPEEVYSRTFFRAHKLDNSTFYVSFFYEISCHLRESIELRFMYSVRSFTYSYAEENRQNDKSIYTPLAKNQKESESCREEQQGRRACCSKTKSSPDSPKKQRYRKEKKNTTHLWHSLNFFSSKTQNSENTDSDKYESANLIDPKREVVVEYIFAISREKFQEKYTTTENPRTKVSDISIRKLFVFAYLPDTRKDSQDSKHVDYGEGEESAPRCDYTILVIVYERYRRIPGDTIYLSSEKC